MTSDNQLVRLVELEKGLDMLAVVKIIKLELLEIEELIQLALEKDKVVGSGRGGSGMDTVSEVEGASKATTYGTVTSESAADMRTRRAAVVVRVKGRPRGATGRGRGRAEGIAGRERGRSGEAVSRGRGRSGVAIGRASGRNGGTTAQGG